jgi:DNA polymerase-3 subunit gamma/tau
MPVYAALYRQWRPRRFADMVGQEHVTRTLRNALRAGTPAHAYLFCGPRGTGKTSAARILAAALNCLQPEDGDACTRCAHCQQIAEDRFLDVREIDAASNRQVEDVRALRDTVGYAPAAGRHKVYILDEVHMLTEASWNTLLKTLEEPPPATTFVLCTTDPQHVIGTVVSRCQRFDFRRLTAEEIERHLAGVCEAEGVRVEAGALAAIARRADGGLRDALAILEQAVAFAGEEALAPAHVARVLGAADEATARAIVQAAAAGDAGRVLELLEGLYAEGRDMAQVARDLLAALREEVLEAARRPGPSLDWLLAATDLVAQAEAQMRRAGEPRLLLEVALLRALHAAGAGAGAREAPAPKGTPRAAAPTGMPGHPAPAALADQGAPGPSPVEERPRAAAPAGAWERFLETVRRLNRPAHAVLQTAVSHALSDGVLRLVFPNTALATKAAERAAVFARAWHEVEGQAVRVECVGGEAPPGRPASAAGVSEARTAPARSRPARERRPSAPGPGPDPAPTTPGPAPADATEAAFRRALALFDGEPITEGAEGGDRGGVRTRRSAEDDEAGPEDAG